MSVSIMTKLNEIAVCLEDLQIKFEALKEQLSYLGMMLQKRKSARGMHQKKRKVQSCMKKPLPSSNNLRMRNLRTRVQQCQ